MNFFRQTPTYLGNKWYTCQKFSTTPLPGEINNTLLLYYIIYCDYRLCSSVICNYSCNETFLMQRFQWNMSLILFLIGFIIYYALYTTYHALENRKLPQKANSTSSLDFNISPPDTKSQIWNACKTCISNLIYPQPPIHMDLARKKYEDPFLFRSFADRYAIVLQYLCT